MLEVETLREQHELLLRCSQQHVRGAAVGAAFLGLAGGAWATTALVQLPMSPLWAAGLVAGVSLALVATGVWYALRAVRLPIVRLANQGVGRGFVLVAAALSLALVAVSTLLSRSGHPALVPMAATVLVGLHFLPLARLFHLPVYRQAGLWLIALALCTWAFVPHTLTAGTITLVLWPLTLGLGGAAIFWATAAWNLVRLARLLQGPADETR